MVAVSAQPRQRPLPVLRFTDPHRAPGGCFAAKAVPNERLRPSMVPGRGTPWEAVEEFAMSYDGNGYWSDVAALAGRSMQDWTRDRSLPGTLDELRGCLFYEQRRWHHFGQEPHGRAADYLGALLEAIAALVRDRGPVPGRQRTTAEAG